LVLEFDKFNELNNNGHSHQNNYLLTFKGNNLGEVTNTIMFNTYTNQVNYSTITWIGAKFKTSKHKNSFNIGKESNLGFFKSLWLYLIPVLLIISIFIIKKLPPTMYKR